MANEVYQLKVNNEPIKLGKGINADDEFASINDLKTSQTTTQTQTLHRASNIVFSGIACIESYVRQDQEQSSIWISFPITSTFKNTTYQNILMSFNQQTGQVWPVFSSTQYNNLSVVGIEKPLNSRDLNVKWSDGTLSPITVKKIDFIELSRFF